MKRKNPETRLMVLAISLLLGVAMFPAPGHAQCPKITIQVDNDISGSGYSEDKPNNWITHSVDSCYKNYRWKPKITVTGWYEVTTSYRATTNRTNNADYFLYDDAGGKKKVEFSQKHSGGCTKKTLGTIYCKVGGACRLVLDGTDDDQSDAADITTFKLTKCSGTPPKNPCAAISKNTKWHVCSWSTSTCAGTYDDKAGCIKYCAAAGMICMARYGGTAPCTKEPKNKIPCSQSNTHQSDYCECALPDAGVPKPDSAPQKKDAAPSKPDAPVVKADGPVKKSDAPVTAMDGPVANQDGTPANPDQAADSAVPNNQITSGCSCRVGGSQAPEGLLLLVLLALICRRRGQAPPLHVARRGGPCGRPLLHRRGGYPRPFVLVAARRLKPRP